jgi:mannose-6-phosphate isomerase-like protein (cupin superfamily)
MGRGLIVRPSKVKPFQLSEFYTSRMLLDDTNSEAKSHQINQGILKKGGKMLNYSHPGYDEVYVILKGKCIAQLDNGFFNVQEGDIMFVPGGVTHGLDNSQGDEDLMTLTIWAGTPPRGTNPVYDRRIEQWGKSYIVAEED